MSYLNSSILPTLSDMSNSPTNSSASSNSNGLSVPVIITIVVLCGVVQIVVVILIIRCVQKIIRSSTNSRMMTPSGSTPSSMYKESRIEMEPMEEFLHNILKDKPMRFTPQNLVDFTQNYVEKLGSGGNGAVYKGQFPDGTHVAVKVLHGTSGKKEEEQFMAEVGTIGKTYHINLVKLYGFCFDKTVKALVYEFMENGSLDQHLFDRKCRIEWAKLYEIATGTAKGIRYLHEECQQKIVHYDIKPANILLTPDFLPKVADFGLAKLCDRKKNTKPTGGGGGGRGTPGYAAPEMWLPLPVTHKCDVYSFGMLLLEILGKRRNYDAKQVESREWFPIWAWRKYEQGEMESMLSACGIEEEDREKAERMCQVALRCIQYQPESRPEMNCVVKMLEWKQQIPAVDNPFEHMDTDSSSSALWSSITSTTYSSSRATGKDDTEVSGSS
ncbi:unnamed protein product [Musa banksii]